MKGAPKLKKTYDQYLIEQEYCVYFVFGQVLPNREDALGYAAQELARQGKLVEVTCGSVPDCACQNCGEMLFDWQETVGERAGSQGSDKCWFSLSGGLVCGKCAMHEAGLEIYEEDLQGNELIETDLL